MFTCFHWLRNCIDVKEQKETKRIKKSIHHLNILSLFDVYFIAFIVFNSALTCRLRPEDQMAGQGIRAHAAHEYTHRRKVFLSKSEVACARDQEAAVQFRLSFLHRLWRGQTFLKCISRCIPLNLSKSFRDCLIVLSPEPFTSSILRVFTLQGFAQQQSSAARTEDNRFILSFRILTRRWKRSCKVPRHE